MAAAQPVAEVLEPVVVTASRSPQPLSEVLADVSVLQRSDIERSGALGLADLLARLPGVSFARNGGPGTATSVFVRGGESRHTAVYLDGVRIDSQSTGGAVWEQIPLDQIERIEVLRGPAAAVYGSDAVAGVVQLFSRRGQDGVRPSAALSVGSAHTVIAQADVRGASSQWDYALGASQGRSDGFNAREAASANPDADGWRRRTLHARLGHVLTEQQRIEANWLDSRLDAQYDGSLTADDRSALRLRTAALSWSARWSGQDSSQAQWDESRSTSEFQPNTYRTETTLRNLVLQHERRLGTQTVSALLERREDRLLNPSSDGSPALQGQRHQLGLMLGWRGDAGASGWQAHLRQDRDSEFGDQRTGSLAWGAALSADWRFSASAATSFRAPTLFQRFSEYGVASLVPESGRHLELGLRRRGGAADLALSAWRNRVRDLIQFGDPGPCASPYGCYENIGRALYQGLTLSANGRAATLAWRGSVDWHDARNQDTGAQLARRARRAAFLGLDAEQAGWSLGAEVHAVGARFDDAANTQRLGGYTLLNLRAGRALAPGLALEARIDNAGDKDYQTARTYATGGRAVLASLRWAMP